MARRKRKHTPDLDIVIPVYNQPEFLHQCLAGLDGVEANIIVVDDASNISIVDAVKSAAPNARILRNMRNMGFPTTATRGVEAGHGKYVLLLNSDVVISAEAIEKMKWVLAFGRVPPSAVDMPTSVEIGIVAPKLTFDSMSPHGKTGTIQHAGIALNHRLQPFHLFLGWRADHPKANEMRSVQAVSGACMMFKRNVWRNIERDGMEPLPTVYGRGTYEDVEFCLLARNMGYRVVYVPDATGTHYVGASASLVGGYDLVGNYSIFQARMRKLAIWDGWYQV